MPFPQDRFTRAGATTAQLDTLQADYEALSVEAQASYDARLAPLSDYQIADLLSEPVAEVEDAPEPEVSAPAPAPSPSASSSSSSRPLAGSSSSDGE